MATTTVLQFDPLQTNCQTDGQYLADADRVAGFGTGVIWPSPLANKSLNQLSNYLFALFTAFAQKGFTTSDANVPLLTAVCANFLTTADILPNIVSVASSPTPVFNAAASNGFQMTLTGNVTSSTISGLTPGQLIAFYFAQDATGGRTVTFPTSFVGAIQPDPTANAVSLQMFRVDLGGIPRAVTPVVSQNGTFVGVLNSGTTTTAALSATSITLASGAPVGTLLFGNGTSFVTRTYTVVDVTGSRAGNTGYQNNTAGPMDVSGSVNTSGDSNVVMEISANSSFSPAIVRYAMNGGGGDLGFTCTVPQGYWYKLVPAGAVSSLHYWSEGSWN